MWSHFVTHFDPKNTCAFNFVCPCQKCYTFLFLSGSKTLAYYLKFLYSYCGLCVLDALSIAAVVEFHMTYNGIT